MRYFKILLITFFMSPVSAFAIDRYVENYDDGEDLGRSLRYILKYACDDAGDDTIYFVATTDATLEVVLDDNQGPLVIPEDCKGDVTIKGNDEKDTIINAKNLTGGGTQAGDACLINVYGSGHTIENLSLVNYETGAGLCLFGRNNTVKNNRIGTMLTGKDKPNKYGIVLSDAFAVENEEMDGDENTITSNQIANNVVSGIWLESDGNTIAKNTITYNEGPGIYVDKGATDNVIGGTSFDDDANVIQFNESGIVLADDEDIKKIKITHNLISQNLSLGIDLGDDGLTSNDNADADIGPNKFVNSLDHFQIFSLPANGVTQYYAWGIAASAASVELFFADDEDIANDAFYSGGSEFIKDIAFSSTSGRGTTPMIVTSGAMAMNQGAPLANFEILPTDEILTDDRAITGTVIDNHGNTSEYAAATIAGIDSDSDGIVDEREIDTNPNNPDTDGDSLADGVEDKNHNGIWDEDLGETDPTLADTDDDNISDWAETHADGTYGSTTDTNPLLKDTDGDGRNDGREDKNHNGIIEVYLGETNPLVTDTDADGFNDKQDTCPSVYNPNQEEWLCDTGSGLKFNLSAKDIIQSLNN